MIYLLFPSGEKLNPRKPITLHAGEVEGYDFSESAKQIYQILQVLHSSNLIADCPYVSADEIVHAIQTLGDDIDLGSDELQISEYRHLRIEYRDEMMSIELFVGV